MSVSGEDNHLQISELHVCHGKLGRDVIREQGYEAAQQVAIALLGTIRDARGDLDRVGYLVKLLGMGNSTEDLTGQPYC